MHEARRFAYPIPPRPSPILSHPCQTLSYPIPPYPPLPVDTFATTGVFVRASFNASGSVEDYNLAKRERTIHVLAGLAGITVDPDEPPTLQVTAGSVQLIFSAPMADKAQAAQAAHALGSALASPQAATAALGPASIFVLATPVIDMPVDRVVHPMPLPPSPPSPVAPSPEIITGGAMDRDTGITLGATLIGVGCLAAVITVGLLFLFRKRIVAQIRGGKGTGTVTVQDV